MDNVSPSPSAGLEAFCPECAYNLRGIASARCPECGFALARLDPGSSRVPWERRDELGNWSAFWRTVWCVAFDQAVFARAIAVPVDPYAARSFRRLALGLVFAAFLLSATLVAGPELAERLPELATRGEANVRDALWRLYRGNIAPPSALQRVVEDLGFGFWVVGLSGIVLAVAVSVHVVAATPVQFFEAARANATLCRRSSLLVDYAVGPAAVAFAFGMPLLGAFAPLIAGAASTRPTLFDARVSGLLAGVAFMITVISLLIYWQCCVDLARRALRGTGTAQRVTTVMPCLWLVGGAVTLIGIPLVLLFLWCVVHSLL